jgi:hypothetical protein
MCHEKHRASNSFEYAVPKIPRQNKAKAFISALKPTQPCELTLQLFNRLLGMSSPVHTLDP